MSWQCPNCTFVLEDTMLQCNACGYQRKTKLVLTSQEGLTWKTFIDADITRKTYKRLYSGIEHQYIPKNEGEHPFSVIKDENNLWFLDSNPDSPVGVALNGEVCDDEMSYQLKEHDTISIVSRSNPSKHVALLEVSFLLAE